MSFRFCRGDALLIAIFSDTLDLAFFMEATNNNIITQDDMTPPRRVLDIGMNLYPHQVTTC